MPLALASGADVSARVRAARFVALEDGRIVADQRKDR